MEKKSIMPLIRTLIKGAKFSGTFLLIQIETIEQ